MKVYETKNTQEEANVLDCLSDMAISGPVIWDDFYAYTLEWTQVVNRGSLFEVKDVFPFFWKFEILVHEGLIKAFSFCGYTNTIYILQCAKLKSIYD